MHKLGDRLLFAVSAKQSISWAQYIEIFDELYAQQKPAKDEHAMQGRYRSRQVLDSLAYCDFSFSPAGHRVYSSPAVLARLPLAGLPKAVLIGERSPASWTRINRVISGYRGEATAVRDAHAEGDVFSPTRIEVEATSPTYLSNIAKDLRVEFPSTPPAWQLLQYSGSLDDYLGQVEWRKQGQLGWQRRDFNSETLSLGPHITQLGEYHLSVYTDPVKSTSLDLIWRGDQAAPVDRSWGRFAVLKSAGREVILYDANRFLLGVPVYTPLPNLLSRALALCSGYAPDEKVYDSSIVSFPGARKFSVYRWVPKSIAEAVADKLGQRLVPASL